MPRTGSKGRASAKTLVPVLRRCCFMAGFCENLTNVPARTAFSRTRSQIALSKLRTPQPVRLCARRSGEDILSSSTRRSWERRAFSAVVNCSAQEYDTPSTTNDDGRHCKKQEGGCQNSTTCSVEYSSVGPKTDGAEPSVIIWRDGSVLFREHWTPGARDEHGPTDPGLVALSLVGEIWPQGRFCCTRWSLSHAKRGRGL